MIEDIKKEIEHSLKAFAQGNLTQNAIGLFQTLGYATDRQAPLAKPNYSHFKDLFVQVDSRFNEDKAQTNQWKYVDLLFQLTKEEVSRNTSLFDTKQVDRTIIETYLFFVIELAQAGYSRTALSHITREVNRLFPMPVLILFKHGSSLTLSVIDRRLHKRDETKDVLEKVTLIKDINIASPHRAHIEILFDLSLPELTRLHSPTNFVELHAAWRATLNISELNKKFYKKIAAWYFWAVKSVEFPMAPGIKDKKVNSSINVIRLLTRLIFVWFLKEKHLVPDDLFDERKLSRLLKKFDGSDGKMSDYYKAILQNLFFATLNQKMNTKEEPENRRFATDERDQWGRADDYNITNLYRYKEAFQNPDEALKVFSTIPFLNGGLFDCLDKPDDKDKRKVIRIDGFSRNPRYQPTVPDILFFGGGKDELEIDLSDVYDDKKHKRDKVKGLIHILNDYKFTIAENTPVEEEIALDPELLGRIFENLLAEYNPETGTTARKATGSFYTPREIVNYMVDESLIAYLKTKLDALDLTPALSDLTPDPSPKERGGMLTPGPSPEERGDEMPRYMTTDAETWRHLKPLARELRKEQTEAEKLLWQRVRDKQLGVKFRRQHAIGEFIVDFVCIENRLIVELDGEVHKEQREYDEERTRILNSRGFRVIRFWNSEVTSNIERVLSSIKTALNSPLPFGEGAGVGSINDVESRLRHLVSYSDVPNQFSSKETDALIDAIHTMKVLDPACGSGAFPMGVLLKVVHILHKLDPENRKWKQKQIDAAEQIPDSSIRQATLESIEEAFSEENNFADYGRKLYLIENCIYGVDIQPIATQIAKLRFFISLLVDQRGGSSDLSPNPSPLGRGEGVGSKPNRGVLSLPNLETKFVAANTLIGLGGQDVLKPDEFHKLEDQLKKVRHDYFNAKTRRDKMKYMAEDKKLREAIAESLRHAGMQKSAVDMLAHWDPYDQNVAPGFFSPEWMYGMPEGFDIVLGNPPYVRQEELKELKPQLSAHFECYTGTSDLYVYFWERGVKLLKSDGTITYISSNKFFRAGYGEKLRRFLTKQTVLRILIDFGDRPVFEATTYPCVLVASRVLSPSPSPMERGGSTKSRRGEVTLRARTIQTLEELERFADVVLNDSITMRQSDLGVDGWRIEDRTVLALLEKIKKAGVTLEEYVHGKLYRGIITGYNEAFVIDEETKKRLIKEDKRSAEMIKPVLRGRDVKRYSIDWQGLYLIYVPNGWTNENRKRQDAEKFFKSQFPAVYEHVKPHEVALMRRDDQGEYWWEMRPCTYLDEFGKAKIVYPNILKQPEFALDEGGHITNQKCFFVPRADKYLLAFLNSSISMFLFQQLLPKLRGDFFEPSYLYFKEFPIATPSENQRRAVEERVEKILAVKKKDGKADTGALEKEIDVIVYKLYGLTYDEVMIVDPEFGTSREEYERVS